MKAPFISISDSPHFNFFFFFQNISHAEILKKKRYTISIIYLDYFERKKKPEDDEEVWI